MADYDLLPSYLNVDFGEIQEDWNELWEDIATTPMKGKVVALFGLATKKATVSGSRWWTLVWWTGKPQALSLSASAKRWQLRIRSI